MSNNALTWSALFSQGTLIDTDIRQCRFDRKLEPEDVGITMITSEDEKEKNYSKLQFKLILSDSSLDKIATAINKVKNLVEDNSLCFPLVEGARYIPKTRVDSVVASLREIKSEFDSAVQELASRYQEICDKNINRLRGEVKGYAKGNADAETLTEAALQKLLASFPSAEMIRQKFSISWKSFSIAAPIDQRTAEALEEETRDVKDVVHEMVVKLRQELEEKIDDILQIAQKHETLPARTQEATENLLTRLEGMNILGDSALNTAIRQMRSIVGSGNMETISQELVGLKNELEESAEAAKKAVEEKLTSMGKRVLDLE